jgi:hypothetical protein
MLRQFVSSPVLVTCVQPAKTSKNYVKYNMLKKTPESSHLFLSAFHTLQGFGGWISLVILDQCVLRFRLT